MPVIDADEFATFVAEFSDRVLTIRMRTPQDRLPDREYNLHWELAEIMSRARGWNDVRVIVLTGLADGAFQTPFPIGEYGAAEARSQKTDPKKLWTLFTGASRLHEATTGIEKPVIAKVNGDAIGFGQSIMFSCDLIVARDDARIYDHHLSNGEGGFGLPYGVTPGDGGLAFVPSHMTPVRAKEYLMLAKEYSAKELADMGAINYAVPAEQLDAVTDGLVQKLLQQSAYSLAWTKRVVNRQFVADMHSRMDASAAYELVDIYQAERNDWRSYEEL
jgi:enoyl-CoA hydratase